MSLLTFAALALLSAAVPDSVQSPLWHSHAATVGESVMADPGAPEVELRHHVRHPSRAGVYYPEEERLQDSIAAADPNRDWWHLFKEGRLSMQDTTVEWPKFLEFCVGVYNWGDEFFNGTDHEYVVGTGRRWKVRLVNDNWTDAYSMELGQDMKIQMLSEPYSNAGIYLQYMAVSIGYNIDLTNVIGNRPINHKKMNFGFSCARFNAELTYSENTGGTYLRTFGDYDHGRFFKKFFPGLVMRNLTVDAYYFFNNRRYSYGAAYGFAKIQKRSAGSIIAGFSYAYQDVDMDLSLLPPELLPYLTIPERDYKFRYNDYSLLVGYGYNFVVSPHVLINLTALPAIGINHSYEDSVDGASNLLSVGIRARGSVTYNIKDFFLGGSIKFDGHWYNSSAYSFFSSLIPFSITAGVRF